MLTKEQIKEYRKLHEAGACYGNMSFDIVGDLLNHIEFLEGVQEEEIDWAAMFKWLVENILCDKRDAPCTHNIDLCPDDEIRANVDYYYCPKRYGGRCWIDVAHKEVEEWKRSKAILDQEAIDEGVVCPLCHKTMNPVCSHPFHVPPGSTVEHEDGFDKYTISAEETDTNAPV